MFGKKIFRQHSGPYARQRISELLLSERLQCSPQMIDIMKHEMIRVLRRYVSIKEEQLSVRITEKPTALLIQVPLSDSQDEDK